MNGRIAGAVLFCTVVVLHHAAGATCLGDCGEDGSVTVDELLTGVGMVLHTVPSYVCQALCNRGCGPGGAILSPTVDCLVRAANNALHGCAVSCTTDQDCDDGNPCSLDICAPSGCVHECRCF